MRGPTTGFFVPPAVERGVVVAGFEAPVTPAPLGLLTITSVPLLPLPLLVAVPPLIPAPPVVVTPGVFLVVVPAPDLPVVPA